MRPVVDPSRREFLRRALTVAAFAPLATACGGVPAGGAAHDGGRRPLADGGGGDAVDGGVAAADAGVDEADGGLALNDGGTCQATRSDVRGPFHREGAPFQMTIASSSEVGERLFISGVVRGPDCRTPVANALIDVWHANAAGRYDNDDSNRPPPSDVFRLRGRLRTDAEGRYAFESIVPGRYLNGARYRPSHVHYEVLAEGHAALVTQLYFQGDPFLEGDPFADEGRAIPLTRDARGAHGRFDIVLA